MKKLAFLFLVALSCASLQSQGPNAIQYKVVGYSINDQKDWTFPESNTIMTFDLNREMVKISNYKYSPISLVGKIEPDVEYIKDDGFDYLGFDAVDLEGDKCVLLIMLPEDPEDKYTFMKIKYENMDFQLLFMMDIL